ncbi:MAG: elongation factor G [Candidatus Omnitrophica bacterium]|nr:elongation factor G [Candidatus Omnitrophota bacterium]
MEGFDPKMVRSIALVSHAQAGKTSLAESLLFVTGATSRLGKPEEGNTLSDYNHDEIERKISINSSIINCSYNGHFIHIIDTPGYADFIGEVYSSLPAVDAGIVVIDAAQGIEVGTERVWALLEEASLARIIFVNKTDKEDVNAEELLGNIKEGLSKKIIVVGKEFDEVAIESIAETDDALLEKYLEQGSLSQEELLPALHKATSKCELFPLVFGSVHKQEGIGELLEAIIKYLPSPLERPPLKVIDSKTKEEKEITSFDSDSLSAQVFKSISDPYVGQLSILRIFSGTLSSNGSFYNVTKDVWERFGQIHSLQGKNQKPIPTASCGDIIAIAKLKSTKTGDTITDGAGDFLFKPIQFPEPAISSSIRPKSRADEGKISVALSKLTAEDPTFKISLDQQTKELIISGVGDLHLDVMVARMRQRFHVDVEMGTPKVAYKETISKTVKIQAKYKKQSGGRGQYGDVWLELQPLPQGENFEFVDKVFGGAIPKNFIPSVEKGVLQACREGAIAGYPIVDIKVILYDGSYHNVDSSDMAFQIAGAMALRKGVLEAAPKLLEPIMDVEIVIPDDYTGQISGDLNSRRGRIMGIETVGKKQKIKAQVPLSEMFKYANDLRSITADRGAYSMRFSHYEDTPQKVLQGIVAAAKQDKEEKK